MRIFWIVLIVVFAAAGALFGALNGGPVRLDFYVAQVTLPIGAAWLLGVLAGWVAGGLLIYFGAVWPLRTRLARQRRELDRLRASSPPGAAPVPPADA